MKIALGLICAAVLGFIAARRILDDLETRVLAVETAARESHQFEMSERAASASDYATPCAWGSE